LHPRGNFEGFLRAASAQKWLEAHGDTHWTEFYTDYGVDLQKRFFSHFLKGEDNGWDRQPRVQLKVRHPGEKFVLRHENEWPLARTQWTKFYLDPTDRNLRPSVPTKSARLEYEAMGDGLIFLTPPLTEAIEICGPVTAKLHVSSSTTDADLFLVLRVFAPDGKEIVFHGAQDPRTPIGLGWLRASHRKLDTRLSEPWRPYHTHDERWPLVPGEPVELNVEIWPTCIVVPPNHRIGLSIRGRDYEFDGPPLDVPGAPHPLRGVGPFLHENPKNRPRDIFAGTNALHFAPDRQPYLLLPIIPPR
jgi:predicted acyl esterase